MSDVRLAIIVPTIGRPSLRATLLSIAAQTNADDQVIVVSDGEERARDIFAFVAGLAAEFVPPRGAWGFHLLSRYGYWGHPLRNLALDSLVAGDVTHVATIDDDDVYLPGALAAMRERACERPVVFRMRFGRGHPAAGLTLWRAPQVRFGNIGTPMILAPYPTKARFSPDSNDDYSYLPPGMQPEYVGDLSFLKALVRECGEPVWDERVIAEIRPSPVAQEVAA